MKTTENSTIEITYTQDERLIIEAKKEHYFGLGYKIEFQEIPSDIEKEGKIIFSKFKKS